MSVTVSVNGRNYDAVNFKAKTYVSAFFVSFLMDYSGLEQNLTRPCVCIVLKEGELKYNFMFLIRMSRITKLLSVFCNCL
jgi:hypothetical protein